MACEAARRSVVLVMVWLCALAAPSWAQTGPASIETFLKGAQRLLGELPAAAPAEALPEPATQPSFHLPIAAPDSGPIDVTETGGLISLSVRDASLRNVLAALAETQSLNLVIAAPADALVTAEFKKRPLGEVLETLLTSTGHTWTQRDDVIVVTSVAAGGDLAPDVQGRRVAVMELDFASAADLQPAIEGLLSTVGQSYFVETNPADNRRTKELLIVEDLHPYVARIEHYVAEADQPPRQVLIEVNLLQVNLEDDQRCGVNFEALNRVSGATLTLRSAGLADPTASPGFFIESAGGDLDSVIEALITTTDAKSIASPKILAVNGQESQIQIGERLGYRVTTTTETSSLESVDFLDVGVVLRVTPRVTRDGRVLMRIAPKVSTGAVNPDTGVPDEETTELQTDALLSSGQGMVIGGLIQERDDTRISRIPVLGSIPYVNGLFRRRAVSKRRTELIVALVPHVLPYTPCEQCRNDTEFARAREPLTYGPLCRFPRPYEPRLYDPYADRPRLHLLDRRDPFCGPDEKPKGLLPGVLASEPRRLPPTAASTRVAEKVGAEQPVLR